MMVGSTRFAEENKEGLLSKLSTTQLQFNVLLLRNEFYYHDQSGNYSGRIISEGIQNC